MIAVFRAIMSMDARDVFPVDMVEQMLKFTPSPEERALLDEHADEIDHLARADRFLFELSKITHYEQRLRTLHYKKKFSIWYMELKPKIISVLEASKEVQRSKRLRKMLEIILAFGNYMNRYHPDWFVCILTLFTFSSLIGANEEMLWDSSCPA